MIHNLFDLVVISYLFCLNEQHECWHLNLLYWHINIISIILEAYKLLILFACYPHKDNRLLTLIGYN